MLNIQSTLTVMQLILAFCNLGIMMYALSKFIKRPHDKVVDRIIALEVQVEELMDSLKQGNDRFRDHASRFEKQYDTNEVLIRSVLALIEFEMQYCIEEKKGLSTGLTEAKKDLDRFLSRRYKQENADGIK